MSQNRSVSGGVRNLRAMFENKDDAAPPPDRGRSPVGVVGNNSDQNRPLSKVRTSFVAVDRNGLRKEAELNSAAEANTVTSSPEGSPPNNNPTNSNHHNMSSFSKRRSSFSINEDINPQAVRDRRESIAEEFEARRESELVSETIPEAAIETPSIEQGPEKQLGSAAATSTGPLPTRARPELTKNTPTLQPKARRPSTLETLDGSRPSISNDASPMKPRRGSMAVAEEKPTLKPSPDIKAKGEDKSSIEKTATKSSLSAEPKASPRPSRSPAPPKTPTSPHKASTKPAAKSVTSSTSEKKPSRLSAATATKTSPAGAKPKAKSPTRPAKLPSSLMAPTAASVKKTAVTPPVSMKSDSKTPSTALKSGVQRKPSTLKKEATTTTTTKPPRRAGSKPPASKQPAAEEAAPKPRSSGATSEGFLARMMRPTAASAQKTHDKPVTPPKRTRSAAKRPGTQNGHRANGSPETRKSKSMSPEKPRKKSLEHEKQPNEDAVVMEALMNGQPVEEAVEELTVETEHEREKLAKEESKKAQEKPQIASTKPIQAPAESPVDPESSGPAIPPSATGVVPVIADSPLKMEVKVDTEHEKEPSISIPRKESKTGRKSEDKPADPFQALKETPSMSEARKGPPSTGEGTAIKPSLLEAFESGSAIADDDEEDLPTPIPHKSSIQEPEEEAIPEEATPETEDKSFDKTAVEKEISEQTKAATEELNGEEVKTPVEEPKVQKPRAVQQLKVEEEAVAQSTRKDSTIVKGETDKENASEVQV